MSDEGGPATSSQPDPALFDCPLSRGQQTRNLVIYGCNVGLIYLSAPVLYLMIQPALCEKLDATKTVSNLPSAVYFWMTPLPIVVAWLFPKVRQLKPVLVACYLITAGLGALVAASLLLTTPAWAEAAIVWLNAWLPKHGRLPLDWTVPAMLLHAAVTGCTLGVVATFQWEVIGRGVSESRRGQALGLAFGLMPLLAVVGSAASQAILDGTFAGVTVPKLDYPKDFAILFGGTVPTMVLAATLALGFVIPRPPVEVARKPFLEDVRRYVREHRQVHQGQPTGGLLAGLFFRLPVVGAFLGHRGMLVAALAMMLVGAGYNILPNITLYTQDALGEAAAAYVGYQGMLRFGFKVVAGLALGWLLTKTNPKLPALVVAGFLLAGPLCALLAPGVWFLASFGLMGAGELFGVYYPNYILTCSAKSKMRRNMAFVSMLNMPCGVASVVYGGLADEYGIPSSLMASIGVMAVALLLVQFLLPARPRPREEDLDESDRALARPVTANATA